MVKPVNHDMTSALSTGWWGAAKGGLAGFLTGAVGGFLAPIVAGAALGALALGAVVLSVGMLLSPLPYFTVAGALTAGAIASGVGAAVGGVGGAVATPATTVAGASWGTLGGASLGLMGAGKKITREKAAYHKIAEQRAGGEAARLNDAAMQGMQQGYQIGAMEKEQQIMSHLQQAHAELVMRNAGMAQEPGANAAKVDASRAAGLGSPAIA